MAIKKAAVPSWNVQVKLVMVADVSVEAQTLEEAIILGKTWKRSDIVEMDEAATEADSNVQVIGAYSEEPWGTD